MLIDICKKLSARLPEDLDLTNSVHLDIVASAADSMLGSTTAEQLEALEEQLVCASETYPLACHLAVKLAKSKSLISSLQEPLHLSVVFAVYKEHTRILTADEHPHGEDFLIRKAEQLNWLFGEMKDLSWDMIVVDDGCPEGTAEIAEKILSERYEGNNIRVLRLEDAISDMLPVTLPMKSTSESQKGGAIAYGMWEASRQKRSNHVVAFTDADLSTHLGQSGLLIDAIVNRKAQAAIGSRREPTSVVVKKGVRNDRGKLFIYLWKRLLPELDYIIDTQCGFKAFRADLIADIVMDMIEKKFAFDIELLLKTELQFPGKIDKVAIAWIDSEAASTTTDIQPYLPMLQAIVKMCRTYLVPKEGAVMFADFIDSLDEQSWQMLLENIPAEITGREPAEFSGYEGIKVDDLKEIL